MSKYQIKDWAGNILFNNAEFDHFDEAESMLESTLGDKYEELRGEYALVEIKQ